MFFKIVKLLCWNFALVTLCVLIKQNERVTIMGDFIENSITVSGHWGLVQQYKQVLENEFPDSSSTWSEAGNDYATLNFTFEYNGKFFTDLKTFAKNLLQQLNKSRASQRIFDRHDPAKLVYRWYYIFSSEIDKQLNGISGYYSMDRNFFDNRY